MFSKATSNNSKSAKAAAGSEKTHSRSALFAKARTGKNPATEATSSTTHDGSGASGTSSTAASQSAKLWSLFRSPNPASLPVDLTAEESDIELDMLNLSSASTELVDLSIDESLLDMTIDDEEPFASSAVAWRRPLCCSFCRSLLYSFPCSICR